MIIKKAYAPTGVNGVVFNQIPDQFVSEREKEKEPFIKTTMDFFASVAFSQFNKHKKTFVPNYNLLKGIITPKDFYEVEDEVTRSFVDNLTKDVGLPPHVQMYSILNPPINTMVGELSNLPDNQKVRAFDDDSRDEELQNLTNTVEQMIIQEGKKTLIMELAAKGEDVSKLSEEDLDKMTMEKVSEDLGSFTTLGEKWGNHVLTAMKLAFRTKEKSEDAFKDLLKASREFYHIFEDNSKFGFNTAVINPKNEWHMGASDVKYTSAVSGELKIPYAAGIVEVMEISEMIESIPDLTQEEIKHLRTTIIDNGIVGGKESNLTSGLTGPNSIVWNTYDRLLEQERSIISSESDGNHDDFLGLSNPTATFGWKYTVVTAYFYSKKKTGLLTYLDMEGMEQTMLVDESYIQGAPNEISIQWGWVNQIYMGRRIGPDVYHMKPFKLLPYIPIIGLVHDAKNSEAKSLLDMMKPFQTLYNVCLNQLFSLLGKEKGVVQTMSIRQVPSIKDGDDQDALDMWETEAKERGIIFIDDSPENTKGGSTSSNPLGRLDLSRTQEIQSRYNLAAQLKLECWELVGMNRQRLGSSQASETASANNNSLMQSFAQTKPFFDAHEYLLNQWYQALLDAAKYIESNKETSTIKYITSQGEHAFIEAAGDYLRLKDLWIFVTSRPEDQQLVREFRQLGGSMLQNGASVYDVSVLYTENSVRQMQKIFKSLKEKNEEMQAQNGELEQSKLQMEQQISQSTLEQEEAHHQEDLAMRKYEVDTKANTDLAKAQIGTYFQAPTTDANNNGVPDIMEIAAHTQKINESLTRFDLEKQKLNFQMSKASSDKAEKAKDRELVKEKLKLDREKNKIMARKPKK